MASRSQELELLDDESLVGLYKKEDRKEAVGILFQRYSHLVLGVCLKYLKDEENSKDASMQVFEKVMFDLKKHEVGFFKGWLYRVAQNHCLGLLRAPKKEISRQEDFAMERAMFLHLGTLDEQETKDREAKLSRMESELETLDEHQRTCLRLFYLEQRSYQDVADQTGFSMNQVKSFIQNGKRNLKIRLEKHG